MNQPVLQASTPMRQWDMTTKALASALVKRKVSPGADRSYANS